jgi:2-methylcitrate dehydratase PrpD
MGEMLDCTGEELIESRAVGYDVCGRIGSSLRHREPRKLIHGHGTWQTFGAAAATARLLRLDRMRAAHALAVAGVNAPVASVMKSVYSAGGATMSKNNFGAAAAVGVSSAMLAREGYKGPLDLLEGETGFWRMAGADECDVDGLLEGLGHRHEILHVGFKPFSCCRLLQGSIEAVLAAARAGARQPDLARILLCTVPIVSRFPFDNARPRTMWEAQFSAPFACAMALLRIPPGPAWFSGEWYEDRDVLSLMQKTVISPLPQHAAADVLPGAAQVTARATLVSRDGKSSWAEVGVARGEASNPLSQEELDEKFLRLAEHRLTADAARALLARIHRLEREGSIRALVRAFAVD